MLLLVSTSDVIQVVTGGTQAISVHASYVDVNSSNAVTPGRLNTAIASAATTTVVGSPGSSIQRNIKLLSIRNKDASTADTITVQHTDGTTVIDLFKLSLPAGYTLTYNDGDGWKLFDGSGNIQVLQAAGGRFLKSTVLTSGTSFTTGTQTNTIRARMSAGGGQGGGAPATTGENGSGGGSGSYAEWTVAVQPNTAYTYAIGAGGSTGGTGAAGQAGGNTTLTVGATTVTCNGGNGGNPGTSISVPVLGGAGGAISTNGTLNIAGDAGEPNVCIGTATDNRSGKGADSPLGGGGIASLNASNATGSAATGFGAGGGGASTTGTAHAGGTGSGGVIIVDEYS